MMITAEIKTYDQITNARELFEIPEGITYLNCANMAPQLKSLTEAGIAAVRAKATPWKLTASEWFSGAEVLRGLAAQLLNADAEGIALVPAASYAIAIAAANLPLASGQSIVLLHEEFPSNVYAWRELARKRNGSVVTVRREAGESLTQALLRSIDDRTGIVAVSPCHWTDGSRVDLEQVAGRTRAVGAGLVIDASQALGANVIDVKRVQPDFLTSVGYKWLLGPYGLAYFYVAPKWRESGTPIEYSWLTRAGSEDFGRLIEYRDDYRPGARRFDMGEFPQFVLAPMATAALRQILAWEVARIESSLSVLTNDIARRAQDIGYVVLPAAERSPHMVGIRHPKSIPAALPQALRNANIYVSFRGDSIRIAPHLYNNLNDIERLFEVLRKHA
jgi:selenocysteine lyase/cysteine desulfurase